MRLNNLRHLCARIPIKGQNSAKFGWIVKSRGGKMKSCFGVKWGGSSRWAKPNDLAHYKEPNSHHHSRRHREEIVYLQDQLKGKSGQVWRVRCLLLAPDFWVACKHRSVCICWCYRLQLTVMLKKKIQINFACWGFRTLGLLWMSSLETFYGFIIIFFF